MVKQFVGDKIASFVFVSVLLSVDAVKSLGVLLRMVERKVFYAWLFVTLRSVDVYRSLRGIENAR